MVKCLWCYKEIGIFGMLFHKSVCLEYLYSKSLDQLRKANLAGLITKDQYINEKRNLRDQFMQRFKPKVYEAFIKRQQERQYIVINPNELPVAIESDMEMISKKVCIESFEISQKSQFLQSFQNPIDYDYNCVVNNYSGYQDIQPMFTSDDNPNNYVEFNQHDELSIIYQLEFQNFGNPHQQLDQCDNSQEQFVQLQQQQVLHQKEENQEDKQANVSLEINEEEKENVLFKLLQKKVKPNKDTEFNETIQQNNNNKKQTHTRSQSRNIKQNSIISGTKEQTIKPICYQEELATEIKQNGHHHLLQTKKKNPPKFSQSTDKINPKINQSIEISSKKEHSKRQKKTKNLISKNTKKPQKTEDHQKSSQQVQKPKERETIKTRHQASLSIQQNKTKAKSINRKEQQKIKKK